MTHGPRSPPPWAVENVVIAFEKVQTRRQGFGVNGATHPALMDHEVECANDFLHWNCDVPQRWHGQHEARA